MRILASILCFISLTAFGSESFYCKNKNADLMIRVSEIDSLKKVSWILKITGADTVSMEGSGVWQKEDDSADAFSSYDDDSAISFKSKRAVFVLPKNQAIYFPVCEIVEPGKNNE